MCVTRLPHLSLSSCLSLCPLWTPVLSQDAFALSDALGGDDDDSKPREYNEK